MRTSLGDAAPPTLLTAHGRSRQQGTTAPPPREGGSTARAGAESRRPRGSSAGSAWRPRLLPPPAGARSRAVTLRRYKRGRAGRQLPERVGEAERSGFLRQQCLDGTGRARARRLPPAATTAAVVSAASLSRQRHGYASFPGAPELPPGLRSRHQPADQPGAVRLLCVPQHGERRRGGGGRGVVAGERAAGGPASRRPRPCGGRLRAVPPGAAALRSSPRGRGRPEPLAGCGGEVGALISGRASAAR